MKNQIPIQIKFSIEQIKKLPKGKYKLLDVGSAEQTFFQDNLKDKIEYEGIDYIRWSESDPKYVFNLDEIKTKNFRWMMKPTI